MLDLRQRVFGIFRGGRPALLGWMAVAIGLSTLGLGTGLAHPPAVSQENEDQPVYTNYRGVHIGSTVAEARKILGEPKDKSDGQDLYLFNENEMATIYFDKSQKVTAIAIDFTGDGSKPPTPAQVVGSDIETKSDGSIYKLVRYPKAGYWVSYNKTVGQSSLVSVTIQKLP